MGPAARLCFTRVPPPIRIRTQGSINSMQRKESIFLHLRFGKSASVRIAYFRICNSPFLVQNGHRKQLFGGLIIIKISSDEPSGARGSLRARVRSASHCCAAGQRVRLHGGRHTALAKQLKTNSTTQKRPRAKKRKSGAQSTPTGPPPLTSVRTHTPTA